MKDGDGDGHIFHDRRAEGRRHRPTSKMEITWITQQQGKVNYPTLEGETGEYHPGEYPIIHALEKPGRTRVHIGES